MLPRTTLRHRFAPEAVSTYASHQEVDPRALGLRRSDVDAIWQATLALYRTGHHPAISLCLRRRGEILLKRSVGHTSGNGPEARPDEPLRQATPDTPFCLFSASKAVTAVVIHLLDDRGLLHIDDPVVEYLPDFGRHGKENTTIRHVLTHRSGIASLSEGEEALDLLTRWEDIVDRLCDARPSSVAGRRLAYHALSGGFVLGEIVRRVTGRDIREVLHDELLAPLGFQGMNYGCPPEQLSDVARSAFTGLPVPWPVSHLVRRALGVGLEEAARFANDPRFLTSIVPSGNIVATADEASRFFQMLLNGGHLDGVEVLHPRTLRRARNESSYMEVDFTLIFPVRYGLGFMLGSDRVSLFGSRSSNAFGHLGFMNTLVWADPDRDISVALLTSGKPFLDTHLYSMMQWVRTVTNRIPPGS